MSRSKLVVIPAAVALAAVVTACGAGGTGAPSADSGGGGLSVSKDDKLAAQVPKQIASDGKLTIADDQTYAPNEFIQNGTLVGMDVDMGRAIAQKLGLQPDFANSTFDGILGGITAGKYETGMSSISINSDREQQVNMVSYYTAGTSLAVLKGNPDKLNQDDLCGKTIAAEKGTTQVEDIQDRTKKCTAAGKPPINLQQFQAQTDVTLALNAKRVQGELADSPVIAYAIKQTGGQLEEVGQSYANEPYGMVMQKSQTQLANAVKGAVQALIADGTYKKILDKWSLGKGAITTAEVNPKVTE